MKVKSSIEEIRNRFDMDVERFSNLETGQETTVDSPLCLELITDAAKQVNPTAKQVLDIGCGAGNYTLKLLQKMPNLNCTLLDLSMPMLIRAKERVSKQTRGSIEIIQANILDVKLPEDHFDTIMAAAVLHHLREDADWKTVMEKIYTSLKPGGSFWIFDLILHDFAPIDALFTQKYAEYLDEVGGIGFNKKVFSYIEKEDSQRSLNFQMNVLKEAGFRHVEVLHKHGCFAAFGGIK